MTLESLAWVFYTVVAVWILYRWASRTEEQLAQKHRGWLEKTAKCSRSDQAQHNATLPWDKGGGTKSIRKEYRPQNQESRYPYFYDDPFGHVMMVTLDKDGNEYEFPLS